MTEIYVGTSGWVYDWNRWGNFDWYVKFSGLNAVELNASFYRFPFLSMIRSWARKGRGLRWAVKVHRSITHLRKLSKPALNTWEKFRKSFEPLDEYIDFYLFQMPPSFSKTRENMMRVIEFYKATRLGSRFAIEFRHHTWFNQDTVSWASRYGFTLVSIDAPIGKWVVSSSGIVYLRMHGRTAWYMHYYEDNELKEIARDTIDLMPEKIYVFFNNNHYMLENARRMKELLLRLAPAP